jgi:hypothetical protein
MEIAGFVQPDFLVNIVPTLEGGVAGVFAGNWASAWQEATRLVDRIFGVPIEATADIVVASAGGYPRDINLYQTGKAMDNGGKRGSPEIHRLYGLRRHRGGAIYRLQEMHRAVAPNHRHAPGVAHASGA